MFIDFVITIFVITWDSGQMARALINCAHKSKGSNLILDMSWTWQFVASLVNFCQLVQKQILNKHINF